MRRRGPRTARVSAITAIAPLAGVLALAGCVGLGEVGGLLERPGAHLRAVRVDALALTAVDLGVDIDVSNPYPLALPVLGFTYAFATAGTPFLEGRSDPVGEIPPSSTRTLTLPVRVDLLELARTLTSLRPGTLVPYRVSLEVRVAVPGGSELTLPLQAAGELPVPAPPVVRGASLDWDELSLAGVRGAIELDVENPNAFALALERLTYALRLGGQPVAFGTESAPRSFGPGGSGTVRVPIDVSATDVGVALLSVLGDGDVDFSFEGDLRASTPFGPIELPLNGAGHARRD